MMRSRLWMKMMKRKRNKNISSFLSTRLQRSKSITEKINVIGIDFYQWICHTSLCPLPPKLETLMIYMIIFFCWCSNCALNGQHFPCLAGSWYPCSPWRDQKSKLKSGWSQDFLASLVRSKLVNVFSIADPNIRKWKPWNSSSASC